MITDKQRKYCKVYSDSESYKDASNVLEVSIPTVHQQVDSVREKIRETIKIIEIEDGTYQTNFGLTFEIEDDEVQFLD